MTLYASVAATLLLLARTSLPGRYTPAHVWAYTWAFAWACQVVLGAGYLISTPVALFVSACNLAFLVGAFIANGGVHAATADVPGRFIQLQRGSKLRARACLLTVAIGIASLELGLRQIGHPGLRFLVSASVVDVAEALVTTKSSFNVNGVWVRPAGISAATLLLLCASVLAGIEASLSRRHAWRTGIMTFLSVALLAALLSLSTGIRSYLLLASVMGVGSYLASSVVASRSQFRIPKKAYATGVVVMLGLLLWTVVVQSARRGDLSFTGLGDTLDYLRAWFAGYIPAFSQWSASQSVVGDGLGTNLLRGVVGPLGLSRGEGVDSPLAAVAIGGGATSNAMTIFRVLVSDFGYAGSVLACAAAGFVAQRIWRRASVGSAAWIVALAATYAAILYSFNYWFFAYGSRIAAVVLAGLVVWAADVRTRAAARNTRAEIRQIPDDRPAARFVGAFPKEPSTHMARARRREVRQ